MGFGERDQLRDHAQRLAAIESRVARLPVREAKALLTSPNGNIIIAQVNESGDVLASDTTFDFDNAIVITGTGPEDGEGTAHKQADKAPFDDDDWVVLFQRTDNDEWWTDEKTSGEVDWITAVAEAHIPNDAYGESVLADEVTAEAPHASLGTFTALNKTGRFIFKGATCVIAESDSTRRIIATDSPTIVKGIVDDAAYADELTGYSAWSGVTCEGWTIDATGLTVTFADPLEVLEGLESGDAVLFAVSEVGGDLTFTAMSRKTPAPLTLFFTHASTGFDSGGADITTTGSSVMIVGDDPGPGITVHNKLLLTGTPTNDILVVGNPAGEYWIVAVSDPTWTWLQLQSNFSEGDPQVFGHSSSGDPLWYDVNDCPTCE